MNPYALPNIIAFVLLLVLSLAVIFQNSRDKNRWMDIKRKGGFIFTNQANQLLRSICARRGNIKIFES